VIFPIAIEPGDGKHVLGVVVPDLPGCFSAGDTVEEAIDNAKEAIELWLEPAIDEGMPVPEHSAIEKLRKDRSLRGWLWAVVSVDLSQLSDKTERVNITLPSRVLRRIDAAAKEAGESRSGYIARRAIGTR